MNPNILTIKICNTVEEAPDYKGSDFQVADLTTAIVVRNGTQQGNDTIDLQFKDEKGNKFVAMITARLLKNLANITITDKE